MFAKLRNKTEFSQVLYSADGDSVQIPPNTTSKVNIKFLFQNPDPRLFRVVEDPRNVQAPAAPAPAVSAADEFKVGVDGSSSGNAGSK